jgi:phosphoribosylformimino-5-aminoimidazole carboxamide ribotide isomerase
MDLLPAIDIRGGRCVRLLRGDYNAETVYGDDPVGVGRAYEAAGAQWIHVVDLDAARSGSRQNAAIVSALCAAVSCAVEVGGGVRSVDAASDVLSAGAARVVVGTAAVEEPGLVTELCARFPGQIAVGLDARGRDVAVRGWEQSSGVGILGLASRYAEQGAAAIIATQIERDGTLEGPDVELYRELVSAVAVPVIASGGIGTLNDLAAVAETGAAGCIVGKALYEGAFGLEEAIAACSRPA